MEKDTEGIPEGKFAPDDWEYMLLQMVNDHSGVDFSMYRTSTFRRRYLKCMSQIDSTDIKGYVKTLEDNPEQLDILLSDLLIGVTSFFRDTPAFRTLKDIVIEPLFSENGDESVRVWVAGCSVGMEAYSIAMLMDSCSHDTKRNFTIFATDICRSALAKASKGVYTEKQFLTVPEEYRSYFKETDAGWKVNRSIRSHMVFSYHDVLSDPPFAHMDLVSCRNLMIYLNQHAQETVLNRLNYSLSTGGYLFLGSGETPGTKHRNLETIDPKWRIFLKTGPTVPTIDLFPLDKHYGKSGAVLSESSFPPNSEEDLFGRSRSFTSCLEERFFPDCVFIDEDSSILFIHGDMNSYLSIPSGIPGGSLFPMLSNSLRAAVRAGLRRASGGFSRVQCETSDQVTIYVSCISPPGMNSVFLLEFIRDKSEKNSNLADRIECSNSDISFLEDQLALLESKLAAARQELRSRTSELQASNEELQSTNEEIRSANEELIASNEELLSSNEELQRVNQQLAVLSDDMTNLVESMDVGSLFLDKELNIRRFNPMVCKFFKITDNDINRSITDFTTTLRKSSMDLLIQTTEKVTESSVAAEISLDVDLSGNWLAKVSPYRKRDGQTQGTVITFVDVTLLRKGEQSLEGSERKFRGLFNGFPIGAILVFHETGSDEFTIIDRNPEFELLQVLQDGITSNPSFLSGILEEDPIFQFNHNDSSFLCEVFRPVDYAEALCVTLKDITTENRINQEKRILREKLRNALLLARMGTWEYDHKQKMVTLSDEAAKLFNLPSDQSIHTDVFRDMIADFDDFFTAAKNALSSSEDFSGMITIVDADTNHRKYFRVNIYVNRRRDSSRYFGYALDVTSEVTSEKKLQDVNDKLAATQRIAGIGLIEMEWNEDFSKHREELADSALNILKLSEYPRISIFNTNLEDELSDNVLRKLKNGAMLQELVTMDISVKNGLGETIYLHLIARPAFRENGKPYTAVVIVDITRRHQMENELKHSDKLRSVGELAGGIAHDFNNQLMGITGFAECLRSLPCDAEQLDFIKGIQSSAERAGTLVRQLLAFSRKGLSHIAPFDLHQQIDDVISLLKRSIDRRIEIRSSLRADHSIIMGDASEMNNALLNLAINARDAMDGSGVLSFSTGNPSPDKLQIVISDTGRGMSEEVLQKAFEPFFTTKPLGDGTGMGLAAVYGTVTAHKGTILLDSRLGEGTRAVLTLPVSEIGADKTETIPVSTTGPMEGTVLLVDDEPMVRTVLKTLIKSLGFMILTASDGVEAIEIYREKGAEIKLVLMDVTMPRKNGIEAFIEMQQMNPDVKVIILSGHSAESTSTEMMNLGIMKVLQKPITISVLATAIRDVIGS